MSRTATRRADTPELVQLHVRVPPALYRALKIRAAERGAKLQELVADLLTRGLNLKKGGAK